MISAETESQSFEKFNAWNKALYIRGLISSVDKTNHLISGQKFPHKTGKCPCACSLKAVGANSICCNMLYSMVAKKMQ